MSKKMNVKDYMRKNIGMVAAMIVLIILFIIACYQEIQSAKKDSNYVVTTGTFVEYELNAHEIDMDREDTYWLYYKYYVDGQEYTYKSDYTTSDIPKLGSKILIQYQTENPSIAYAQADRTWVWVLIVSFCSFGVVFCILISEYYKINQGNGYSDIIMCFSLGCFLIVGSFLVYYKIALQNGYYSILSGLREEMVASILSIVMLLVGIGLFANNLTKILKHNRKVHRK